MQMNSKLFASKIVNYIKEDIDFCRETIDAILNNPVKPDGGIMRRMEHMENGLEILSDATVLSYLDDDEANGVSFFVIDTKRYLNELESFYLYGK